MKIKTALLASCVTATLYLPAHAAISLNYEWDNVTNVTTASWNGTWNASQNNALSGTFVQTSSTTFYALNGSVGQQFVTYNDTFPWSINQTDWVIAPGSNSFGFDSDSNAFFGPAGFTSATLIAGSMNRTGNLMDLGFASNSAGQSGTLTLPSSNGTVNWSTTVVPEPATYGALAGILALGLAANRRRVRT